MSIYAQVSKIPNEPKGPTGFQSFLCKFMETLFCLFEYLIKILFFDIKSLLSFL